MLSFIEFGEVRSFSVDVLRSISENVRLKCKIESYFSMQFEPPPVSSTTSFTPISTHTYPLNKFISKNYIFCTQFFIYTYFVLFLNYIFLL